jgi:hypothetical protein
MLLAWLVASLVAVALMLTGTPAAYIGGHYIPVGNDSFYHARRILDLIADPSSFHEFDPLVHVPEGSTLIWPWGYDYGMSLLVRIGLALHLSKDAMAILDHLPVLASPLALALMLWICRQLQVSAFGSLVAMLALVALPLTQNLYGVGQIDHHFAEQVFVLTSLATSLAWLKNPDSTKHACVTALVFGLAPAIHNGLFIIQFPLVLALAWAWLNGRTLPRTTLAFGITLLVATLLAAAPSTALRAGEFQFYTLSWFHVFFAFCVGAVCVYMSRVAFSMKSLAILAVGVIAALVPVVSQLLLADRFLSVSVEGAEDISEVMSLWQLAASRNSISAVTGDYSMLALILPATWALCLYQIWKKRDASESVFWFASLGGTILLALMVRFHVFGTFALCLPWILMIEEQIAAGRLKASVGHAVFFALLVVSALPAVAYLKKMKITALDPYYALTWDAYPDLAAECARAPGVALSNLDDANYIRFHTGCGVIANNFLLTAFHEKKVREVRSLLDTPAAELIARAPQVRYVFVHRQSLFTLLPNGGMKFLPAGDPGSPDPRLVSDLINASPDALPPGFRLVKELAFEQPAHVVYARVFAIDRPRT